MPLTGIPNVGSNIALDDAAKVNYLALSNTEKKKSSKNLTDTGADLERAAIAVDISESGKNINQLQKDLEDIKNPETRQEIESALETIMSRLSEKGDLEQTKQFIGKAKELNDHDSAALERELLEAKKAAADDDTKFDQWLSDFLATRPADA